jgi:hypothetical protein
MGIPHVLVPNVAALQSYTSGRCVNPKHLGHAIFAGTEFTSSTFAIMSSLSSARCAIVNTW